MKISDPILQIKIGANLTPSDPNVSGSNHLGFDHQSKVNAAGSVLAARLIFSAAGQSVEFNAANGALTPTTSGTVQVETATVVAAAGATAAGNLPLTLTSAKVAGSPLAISVPLTVAAHSTDDLIAEAIRAKLVTLPAVTSFFKVGGTGPMVTLTSIFGFANDATLNLAIAAGLGVTAASTSANTTAGVAGVIIERVGGNGKNFYGGAWVESKISEIAAKGQAPGTGYVFSNQIAALKAGQTAAFSIGADEVITDTFACGTSQAILDVVAICKI